MRMPVWLYASNTLHGLRVRRWGSKRTWLVVFASDMPGEVSATWIAQARPLCFSWGPSESVAEGFANLNATTPRHIFRCGWRAVGVAWCGGRVESDGR